jgi:probable F420-dependent oxidoreductase
MKIGAVFPQLNMGADHLAIRDYAQAVEGLGFNHIAAYDHVVGADPRFYPGWSGYYDYQDTFHEPLVLFGFLAGICQLEFATGILILPQRQATLVAKQAAEVDILCGGRLRLGVGIGWNPVEYAALGERFDNRGRRIEEQIALLRDLWSSPVIEFRGEFHEVIGAGIAPMPIQRPIPIWLGAGTKGVALSRVGRIADGWCSTHKPGPELDQAVLAIRAAAVAAGRDPNDVGIDGRVDVGDGDLARIVSEVEGWRAAGATHVSFGTMNAGLQGVGAHVAALRDALNATGYGGFGR